MKTEAVPAYRKQGARVMVACNANRRLSILLIVGTFILTLSGGDALAGEKFVLRSWEGFTCSSPEQAERIGALRDAKKSLEDAVASVNDEFGMPTACKIESVFFSDIREVKCLKGEYWLRRIVAIKVLFTNTPKGAHREKDPFERYVYFVEPMATV